MKVLLVGHSSDLAGAELSLLYSLEDVLKSGHEATVFLPNEGPLVERIRELNSDVEVRYIRTHSWMGKRQVGLVGVMRLLQCVMDVPFHFAALKSIEVDVMLCISSVTPAPMLAAKLSGLPLVLTLGESLRTNPSLSSVLSKSWISLLISNWATLVLPCSNFVAKQYRHASSVFYPEIRVPQVERKKIPDNMRLQNPRALILGSSSPEKGQLLAIRTIGSLRDQGIEITLDIVTDENSQYCQVLRAEIERLRLEKSIKISPPVRDVTQLFRNAELLFMCSQNEAFGKVTLESIARGVPVIGVDRGGTSEILSAGGGILADATTLDFGSSARQALERDRYEELMEQCFGHPMLGLGYNNGYSIVDHLESVLNPK